MTIAIGYSHAFRLHEHDYIHNGKKLVNPLDSISKAKHMSIGVAELGHLVTTSTKEYKVNVLDTKQIERKN